MTNERAGQLYLWSMQIEKEGYPQVAKVIQELLDEVKKLKRKRKSK